MFIVDTERPGFATPSFPASSAPNIIHTLSVSATHLALSGSVLVMFMRVISGSSVPAPRHRSRYPRYRRMMLGAVNSSLLVTALTNYASVSDLGRNKISPSNNIVSVSYFHQILMFINVVLILFDEN